MLKKRLSNFDKIMVIIVNLVGSVILTWYLLDYRCGVFCFPIPYKSQLLFTLQLFLLSFALYTVPLFAYSRYLVKQRPSAAPSKKSRKT